MRKLPLAVLLLLPAQVWAYTFPATLPVPLPWATTAQRAIWAHMRADLMADPDCSEAPLNWSVNNWPRGCVPTTQGAWLYRAILIGNGDPGGDVGQWEALMYQITGNAGWVTLGWPKLYAMLNVSDAVLIKPDFRRAKWITLMSFAYMYDALDDSQRTFVLDRFNLLAETMASAWDAPSHTQSCLDTDQVSQEYLVMAMWWVMTHTFNPAAETMWAHQELQTLDAAGDARTHYPARNMRECIDYIADKAVGGHWIETPMYNYSSEIVQFMEEQAIDDMTGGSHFPFLDSIKEEAILPQISQSTANLERYFQWADEQQPNQPQWYARWAAFATLHGYSKTTNMGKYLRSFMDDIWAVHGASVYGYLGLTHVLNADPYATAGGLHYQDMPNSNFIYYPGWRVLHGRTGWGYDKTFFGVQIPQYTPPFQHIPIYNSTIQMHKNDEWIFDQVYSYAGPSNEARGVNSVTYYGVPVIGFGMQLTEANLVYGPRYDTTNGFTYLAAAIAGSPWPEGGYNRPFWQIQENTRSIVWLMDHDAYLVYDRVNTKPPNYSEGMWNATLKTYMQSRPHKHESYVHMPISPTVTSDEISWATQRNGTAKVKVLLPLSPVIVAEDEKVVWPSVGGMTPAEKKWHTKTSPPTENQWDTFLNVFNISTNAITPTLVQDTTNKVDAALVSYTGGNYLVAFNAIQGPDLYPPHGGFLTYTPGNAAILQNAHIRKVGYTLTFTTTAATKAILCDLDTNTSWTYKVNGGSANPITPDANGIVAVNIATTGSVTLDVLAGGSLPVSIATGSLPDGRVRDRLLDHACCDWRERWTLYVDEDSRHPSDGTDAILGWSHRRRQPLGARRLRLHGRGVRWRGELWNARTVDPHQQQPAHHDRQPAQRPAGGSLRSDVHCGGWSGPRLTRMEGARLYLL